MKLIKYPRTRHCIWSRSIGDDDKVHTSMDQFHGLEVVVTEKMDGENTSMYNNHYHARSLDSRNHPSRDIIKQLWGNIKHNIPDNYRLCGENVYAEHSISYNDLESYFYGFGVWDDRNVCLDWDESKMFMEEWDVTPVPELYRGIYNETLIKTLWDENKRDIMEGYVIRFVGEIPFDQFPYMVAKFVRKGHVQTSEHWMKKQIKPNKLKLC